MRAPSFLKTRARGPCVEPETRTSPNLYFPARYQSPSLQGEAGHDPDICPRRRGHHLRAGSRAGRWESGSPGGPRGRDETASGRKPRGSLEPGLGSRLFFLSSPSFSLALFPPRSRWRSRRERTRVRAAWCPVPGAAVRSLHGLYQWGVTSRIWGLKVRNQGAGRLRVRGEATLGSRMLSAHCPRVVEVARELSGAPM